MCVYIYIHTVDQVEQGHANGVNIHIYIYICKWVAFVRWFKVTEHSVYINGSVGVTIYIYLITHE